MIVAWFEVLLRHTRGRGEENCGRLRPRFESGTYQIQKASCTRATFKQTKQTPWPESASELYRPRDRRLSAKLVPTFVNRGCHVVIATDPYGRTLGFLDRSRYFFSSSCSIVRRRLSGPLPNPRLLRKSGRAGTRTRTSGPVDRNSDTYYYFHYYYYYCYYYCRLSFKLSS
jgi:hypothetical protein